MKTNILSKILGAGAVAMLITSCIIDDPVPGPVIGGGGDEPEPEPDTEVFITPDGDFSDWEAIPADQLAASVVPDDAFYPTGKKVMAYAGATYINLYVEYRNQPDMPVQIMHLYIDGDNDQTTGMGNPAWTNDGADILFEGELFDGDGNFLGYDPTIFTFSGEPLSGEWEWEEAVAPGLGVCSVSEPVELDNGNTAFEMTVLRSAVPGLGRTFRMGVGLQYDWNDIAYLPAGSAVDNHGTLEHGPAENLLLGGKGGGSVVPTPSNAQITIDGDFADWEALASEDRYESIVPDDAFYPAARKMMAAYNKDYLYVYLEYDGSEEAGVGILDLYLDTDAAFDEKGFATTGAGTWIWTNDGSDLFLQGSIAGDEGAGYDAPIFQYTGTPLAGEWAWTEVLAAGSGAMSGSQAVLLDNGNTAVEIALLRSAVPGLGKQVLVGALLEKADWSGECGAVPALSAVDGNHGAAEKLLVDFTGEHKPGVDPEPTPPTPVESQIAIDGDLSDWDDITVAATLPEGALNKGAKTLKIATDKNYIYLYLAYDNSPEAAVGKLDVYLDTDCAFDADGNATTGKGAWMWKNDGSEILIQGDLFDADGKPGWSWAEVFLYTGAPLADEWAWTSVLAGGSGATASSQAVDMGDGTSVVEASIMRAAIPNLAEKVLLGIGLETTDWNDAGALPQLASPDGSAFGAAEKITVALP